MTYIYIENLKKSFGNNTVFDGLNLTFKKNTFNALLGKSGIGKTTLLRILMNLDQDFSGEIKGLGGSISPIFQENRLLENFSIYENLNYVLEGTKQETIDEGLRALDLKGLGHEKIKNLSGGMKRRVAILRGVLKDSDTYIFDEPFLNMDEKTYLKTLLFVKRRLENKTVIFSTHNLDEVDYFQSRIVRI